MIIDWVIVAMVLVTVGILVIYLIVRDQKDKNEMVDSLNTDINDDDEIKPEQPEE